MSRFRALGFSNKTVNFDENGFFMTDQEIRVFLKFLKKTEKIEEALVLSVPEKTEILYFANDNQSDLIIATLRYLKPEIEWPANDFFHEENEEEKSLCRVSELCFGINSPLYGAAQLFHQFKSAYHLSCREKMAGEFLHRYMQTLMEADKKIKSGTNYRKNTISISYTVVDMTIELVRKIKMPKIAVVGYGSMGKRIFSSLKEKGYSFITVVDDSFPVLSCDENPFIKNACLLEIGDIVNSHDIIIITTEVSEDLIRARYFSESISSLKILIDLSVRGNVDPEVDKLLYVITFDMNDIHQVIKDKIEINKKCIRDVNFIIQSCLENYFFWIEEKREKEALSGLMKKIAARDDTAEKLHGGFSNGNRSFQFGILGTSKIQKLLRQSIRKIQEVTTNKEKLTYTNAINRLFYDN